MFRTVCVLASLALSPFAQAALKPPPRAKVEKDVIAHWKKQWPDQAVEHVSIRSEGCLPGEIEQKTRGKRKANTCLLKVDVWIALGYRLLIYRETEIHYLGNSLASVQLGALQKAWKEGGVPAPTPEQASALLTAAAARLGGDPSVAITEIGRPRQFAEVYRVSLIVDVAFHKDSGSQEKRAGVLATFESDGGDWHVAPGLVF